MDKIIKIQQAVAHYLSSCPEFVASYDSSTPAAGNLTRLEPVTTEEVAAIIRHLPNKTSPLDFIHTSILKQCSDVFASLICNLANMSFKDGCFPEAFKVAQVTPLLKKHSLDPSDA